MVRLSPIPSTLAHPRQLDGQSTRMWSVLYRWQSLASESRSASYPLSAAYPLITWQTLSNFIVVTQEIYRFFLNYLIEYISIKSIGFT